MLSLAPDLLGAYS